MFQSYKNHLKKQMISSKQHVKLLNLAKRKIPCISVIIKEEQIANSCKISYKNKILHKNLQQEKLLKKSEKINKLLHNKNNLFK